MMFDFSLVNTISSSPSVVRMPTSGIDNSIDAYPNNVRFLEPLKKLQAWDDGNVMPLSTMAKFVKCGPFGSNLLAEGYVNEGVCIIRPFNIDQLSLSINDIAFISEDECTASGLHLYDAGCLVFARVGNIAVGRIPKRNYKYTISPNIIIAKLKDSHNPDFVCAFLSSKYGNCQLERALKIVAQPTISTDTVRNLLVPLPDSMIQAYIGRKVELAEKCREEATDYLDQAKKALANALGVDVFSSIIPKLTSNKPLEITSIKPSCSIVYPQFIKGMIGAHAYAAIHAQVELNLQSAGVNQIPLGGIVKEMVNGYDCRDFSETGTPYAKVAELKPGRLIPNLNQCVSIHLSDVPQKQRVKTGDLLVTRKGSFGICANATAENESIIISSEVIRLRLIGKYDSAYVSLFLNSNYGRSKFDRLSTGTMMLGINHGNLSEIEIPVLDTTMQKQIGEKCRLWQEILRKSESLVSEAKSDVEALIEGKLDTDAILSGKLKAPTWEDIESELEGI